MTDLVRKLNAVVDSGNPFLNDTIKEAATEIERLQAENERLVVHSNRIIRCRMCGSRSSSRRGLAALKEQT